MRDDRDRVEAEMMFIGEEAERTRKSCKEYFLAVTPLFYSQMSEFYQRRVQSVRGFSVQVDESVKQRWELKPMPTARAFCSPGYGVRYECEPNLTPPL